MNHIIVISHRRSGTHLTMDSITNNFDVFNSLPYVNIDNITKNPGNNEYLSVEKFKQELAKGPRVLKTHSEADLKLFSEKLSDDDYKFIQNLFKESFKVYIWRDGKDVMVSLYEYMKKFDPKVQAQSFKDFIRTDNRIEYWKNHVTNWKQSAYGADIKFLNFKDWIDNFDATLDLVGQFIEQKRKDHAIDVRLTSLRKPLISRLIDKLLGKKSEAKISAVAARKGKTGDYKNYFNDEDLTYYNEQVGDFKI